jgi:predicted secreted hydrolase
MYWKEYDAWGIWRIVLKTSIIVIILISVVFLTSGFIWDESEEMPVVPEDSLDIIDEEPPVPPGNNRLVDKGRHVLTVEDESVHLLSKREWWYFNVFFDDPASDLANWSMIISFNKMAPNDIRYLQRDNFFFVLYDPDGNHYDFGSLDNPRGVFSADKPGVDLTFGESWAQGQYPQWIVHAESTNGEIIADFSFTADFIPVWIEGRSSNLVIGGFVAGDYCIPRCNVTGSIIWNNQEYQIQGIGYHDHVWETNIPRFITNGWEWFNFHFDNGWEMYVSKFNLRRIRDSYLGAIVISPNNRNLVEFNKFDLEKIELVSATDFPRIQYAVHWRLHAEKDDMVLNLDIRAYGIWEMVWPRAWTGMFEGPCVVSGTFSWDQQSVELQGVGMSEVTIVQYLIHRFRILDRLKGQ